MLQQNRSYLVKITKMVLLVSALFMGQYVRATINNEYWIDDDPGAQPAGAGTLNDPWWVGQQGQTFDQLMATNLDKEKIVIHLLPGTYITVGNGNLVASGWKLKSGTRLLGSGIDVSIMKLANGSQFVTAVLSEWGPVGVEVADMTIDCNGQNAGTQQTWLHGVVLRGVQSAIRRVKVINCWGNRASTNEAFPIATGPYNSDQSLNRNGSGNVIEDCEVRDMLGDMGSAISISGAGTISRCRVYLAEYDGGAVGAQLAYNPADAQNVTFINNLSEGGSCGVYSDWGSLSNIVFLDNTFKNCYIGMQFAHGSNAYEVDNIQILKNTVELSSLVLGMKHAIINYYPALNFIVSGNTIRMANNAPLPSSPIYAVNLTQVTGAAIQNNLWMTNMLVGFNDCTNYFLHANYDLQGRLLTNNQVAPPAGMVRKTITMPYAVKYYDKYIGCKNTGPISLGLPWALGHAGKDFIVVDEGGNAAFANIRIQAAPGELINGATEKVINTSRGSVKLISDGSNWFTY